MVKNGVCPAYPAGCYPSQSVTVTVDLPFSLPATHFMCVDHNGIAVNLL
jgi:hypothetical protein